jgi:hypothetical protein
MLRYFLIQVLAIAAFTSPLLFAGEDMPEYGAVKGWSIRVDTTLGNGCFAYAQYEGDTVLRLGVDNRDNTIYVLFGDSDWESIEYRKEYLVEIQFGDEGKWKGDATGMSFDPPEDQPYLWIHVVSDNAANFIAEFMKEQNVALFYNDNSIANLRLKGSYAAGLKLIECQEVMKSNKKDPFSEPVIEKDPFAV